MSATSAAEARPLSSNDFHRSAKAVYMKFYATAIPDWPGGINVIPGRPLVRYQTCEHDVLTTNGSVWTTTGTSGPRGRLRH